MPNESPVTNRRSITLALLACALLLCLPAAPARAAGKATHVVLLVWDGLRPDTITEKDTPTLYKLRQEGTFFENHHAAYPSSTEVNGTALATGTYPRRNGIMANREYRPDIELLQPIATEDEFPIWKADKLTGGLYVQMPTVAEVLRRNNRTTVVAGTKPVALLWDRLERDGLAPADAGRNVVLHEGQARPSNLLDATRAQDGPLPTLADPKKSPNRSQDAWTTRTVTQRLWAKGLPAFTLLWLSEPDYAQHGVGVGSPVARAALKSSDDNLATVLATLEKMNVRDKTDVIVVADHGFSTIAYTIELADELKKAGIKASTSFGAAPAPGDVLVVSLGGSASLYVAGHDKTVIKKCVEAMQASDYAGVIFTRGEPLPGTFTLDQVGIDTKDAPDVVVAMRWWDGRSATGSPGLMISEGAKRGRGQGTHVTLSPYDMRPTLVASGPDFRKAFVNKLPSGNVDLAPTLLWIFGITPDPAPDGRVLAEALLDAPTLTFQPETTTLEPKLKSPTWRQYLKVTKLGPHTYYDEGNGAPVLPE